MPARHQQIDIPERAESRVGIEGGGEGSAFQDNDGILDFGFIPSGRPATARGGAVRRPATAKTGE